MRVRENLCPEDINMGMHVFFLLFKYKLCFQ